ncbi:MAG: hypothetical protein ACYDH1_19460 [Anaerolineaceae bacterium]
MIFAGLLSILQILFLPGLIFNAFIKRETGLFYRLSFTIAFSMLINFLYTVILVSLHLFVFQFLLITILIEIVIILIIYWKVIFQPIGKISSSIVTKVTHSLVRYFECDSGKQTLKQIIKVIKIIALLLASITVGWVIVDFVKQIGSVFGYWDSVISYNRWATEWAQGLFPTGACEYPQLLPTNWSLTYVLTQSQVGIFAKLVQGIFPVLFILAMFDLGLTLGSAGYLLGVPLSLYLLKKFAVVSIFEGFMDVAVTTFIFLAFYMVIKDSYNNRYSQKTLWLSGILILAAAMTKQPGVLAFGAWVLINFILILSKNPGRFWISVKKIIIPTLVFFLLIASWYVFKMNRDALVGERSCIAITNSWAADDLVSGFSGSFLYRLQLLDIWVLFVPILLTSIFFAKREIKLILLCYGLPYLLISFFYGYYIMFMRYLTPISFVFAISASVIINLLFHYALVLVERFPVDGFKNSIKRLLMFFSKIRHRFGLLSFWVIIIIGMVLLAIAGLKYPDSKLIRNYEYQQMGIGNREMNEYLVDFYSDKDPTKLTLSWYPYINYLPGMAGKAIYLDISDVESVKSYLEQENIGFVLKYNSTPGNIIDYLNDMEEKGQLIFITDFGVKNDAVLYEVVRK